MVDSIEDLNAGMAIVVPAVVPAVDLATLTRNDEGHFDRSPKPSVTGIQQT